LQDTLIPKEEWQMGISKIFIKTPETLFALESMRDKYWHTMATRIQRAWRRYLQKKIDAATKIQQFWRFKRDSGQYLELRNYGHRVLGGRKERRSYSVCGYRRFRGDYLGVSSAEGYGGEIREAARIGRTLPEGIG
jgi:myosin-1